MLPLNLSKKCTKCGFETTETKKYFSNYARAKDGLKQQCRKCHSKLNDIYTNTEHGFMINLYGNLFKRFKAKRYLNVSEKEKDKHRCYITKEDFFRLWNEHKKQFGYHCRLTGIKMVCQRAKGKKGAGFLGYSNGVSVDRLNPNIGYTEENIIFISNEANKLKNAVTKELCIKILELYKEKGL
jgi:hypothetical protein